MQPLGAGLAASLHHCIPEQCLQSLRSYRRVTAATENHISNGFHVLLITHALFLIQIPKTFIGNCFQVENVLAAQFECHSDCKNTPLSIWVLFQCTPYNLLCKWVCACTWLELFVLKWAKLCVSKTRWVMTRMIWKHSQLWTVSGLVLRFMDCWWPVLFFFLPLLDISVTIVSSSVTLVPV